MKPRKSLQIYAEAGVLSEITAYKSKERVFLHPLSLSLILISTPSHHFLPFFSFTVS